MKNILLVLTLTFFVWGCSSGSEEDTPGVPDSNITILSSEDVSPLETGGGTMTVSFNSTVDWTASVSETGGRTLDWCSVQPSSGKAGKSTLTVTATVNEGYEERRASLVIKAGTVQKTIVVCQKQKDALIITSNKIEMPAAGGESVVEIKANVSYQYEIEEAARSWLTYSGTRALTASTLVFKVAENENMDKREGKVTVRSTDGTLSEVLTVYQAGSKPSIILTQNKYEVGSGGDEITVELRSNVDYEVKLPENGWITENKARSFSTHTHHFRIAANDSYDSRNAEIVFTDRSTGVVEKVTVVQAQCDAIVVAEQEYTVAAGGGSLSFSVQSNVDFTVSVDADWLKQTTSRGLTDKNLSFTVSENTGTEARTATITLNSNGIKQTIQVTQKGKSLFKVSQNEYSLPSTGGKIQVDVTSTGEYTVKLPDVSWLKESSPRSAKTTSHFFEIAVNDSYDARSAEIVFTDKSTGVVEKVTVVQAQCDAIVVAEREYTVAAEGGSLSFSVQSNVDFAVSVDADWLKQTTSRGLTDKNLDFTVSENTGTEVRMATITLNSNGIKQTIQVTQKGKSLFKVSQNEYSLPSTGGKIQVDVTSTGEYTVKLPDVSWLKESSPRSAKTTSHFFEIAVNDSYDARSAEIVFTDKSTGVVEKVTVVQAQCDAIVVAEREYTVAAGGGSLSFSVQSNVDFTVSVDADWLKQTTSRGLTDKNLSFTVSENTGTEVRMATIKLTTKSVEQTIIVRQFKAGQTGGGIDDMPNELW